MKPTRRKTADELGAHVSTAGGVARAPSRAAEIGSVVLQLFTKQPSRWAEPVISPDVALEFRSERERCGITAVASHDAYLINLATPDPVLFERSRQSFRAELRRCVELGIEFLVTHPGNATDRDVARGLEQNAGAIGAALEEIGGSTMVLVETTPACGQVLGATFEQLAELIERIGPQRNRVGVCLDTCHVWAAGYDLVGDYDGVFARFDELIGVHRIQLFHLNDSQGRRGSRRDRHANIGEGTLGDEVFRRLLTDERFTRVPKVLETPKGKDAAVADRRNLRRLRKLRTATVEAGAGERESWRKGEGAGERASSREREGEGTS